MTSKPSSQQQFSAAVRAVNPSSTRFDQDKVQLYQSLLRNNLDACVNRCFPILRQLLPSKIWAELIINFLAQGKGKTPLYLQLPYEFVEYIQENPIEGYPFAADLAHYEWIELDLEMADCNEKPHLNIPPVLDVPWRLAAASRLLAYDFPVDTISVQHGPQEPSPCYFLVHKQDVQVVFIKLSVQSYQILQLMITQQHSPMQVIHALQQHFPQTNVKALSKDMLQFLQPLVEEGILII